MLERDKHGRLIRTIERIDTSVKIPMLIGKNWRDVALAEVLRLELIADGVCKQLEDHDLPGHEELRRAVAALKLAKVALDRAESDEGRD